MDELSPTTRRAMLDALDSDELIVGAYTDLRGRTCPMLAAHRRGSRTDVGSFPRAWDAFGRATRPRPATQRELDILKALLQEGVSGAARSDGAGATQAEVLSEPSRPVSSSTERAQ